MYLRLRGESVRTRVGACLKSGGTLPHRRTEDVDLMRTVHRSLLAPALAIALAVAPSLALAAPALSSAVSGRILAADLKTPAAGLSVQAVPDGAKEPLARATTDARGRFQLEGLPAGRYLLVLYDAQGAPLAAAPIVAEQATMSVTLALPKPGTLAPGQAEGEKKDDEKKDDKEAAAATKSGFSAWVSSPTGATIVLLASAILVAVGADQLTNDDTDTKEISPPSPTLPPR
jgi:hypothetical protein